MNSKQGAGRQSNNTCRLNQFRRFWQRRNIRHAAFIETRDCSRLGARHTVGLESPTSAGVNWRWAQSLTVIGFARAILKVVIVLTIDVWVLAGAI